MISKDKQYRTRDGREVRIYEIHDKGEAPVHGAYKLDQEWFITQWEEDGSWCLFEHSLDLIEICPRIKREYWVNVSRGMIVGYPQKETLMESFHKPNQFSDACVKIEIDCEEGEGL